MPFCSMSCSASPDRTPAFTVSFATALQAEEGAATECWRLLKFYGLAGKSEEARIIPVAGDLTQPCLGLKDAEYTRNWRTG